VRRRPLRAHGAARLGSLLPLHALPAAYGNRCLRERAEIVPGSLRVLSGEELIRAYEPSDGAAKLFCSRCGSALWSRPGDDPNVLVVRLGAFDHDPGIRPSYRQFVAYAAPWEPIPDDGLPRYPERSP